MGIDRSLILHLFCIAGGAPLSKALTIASVTTSVLVQAAAKTARRRGVAVVEGFAHAVAFRHPGELLFGALLTYYFRLFERQMGTGKYGAYTLITFLLGMAVQGALATFVNRPSASGLYPLIFANMVAFFLEVPSLQRSTVLGINLSDKVFIYIAALQLLLSSGQRSVAAGLAGTIAGLLYHTGLFGLQKFTLPKFIEELFSATVGRALGGPLQRQQIFITPAPPQTTLGEGEFAGGSGPLPARPPTMPLSEPSPEAVQQLVEMGFPAESARQALQQANNNVELALQSLL